MIKIVGDSHTGAYIGMKGVDIFRVGSENLIPFTIHRIGRDGFDLSFYNLNKEDTVFLIFGEIDARCHIQKQIDKGRDADEIIHTLVYSYLEAVLKSEINFIVRFITPTSNILTSIPDYPQVGTLEQRVKITKEFNKVLKEACEIKDISFIDIPPKLINKEGTIEKEYDRDGFHFTSTAYPLLQEQLQSFMETK